MTQLTADQVANRLGVKVETVYAYVSRGQLARAAGPDGRSSLFDPADVERLASRGRPRARIRRAGAIDVVLATALTSIADDRLRYRGHDVADLVRTASFEAVAELLWSGELPDQPVRWTADVPHLPLEVARGLPRTADVLPVVTALLATTQPLRVDLRPPAVMAHARLLLTAMAAAFGGSASAGGRGVAGALWAGLRPGRAGLRRAPALLDTALILLADHEIATSTLAARVAASTRADPFSVVLAGLGAVAGPLHGKAAVLSHRMLLDAARTGDGEAAVAAAMASGGLIPGFGHRVYRGADPRAVLLLEMLDPVMSSTEAGVVQGVLGAATRLVPQHPNVDFALAAMAYVLDLAEGATDVVFAVARTAGWIAHALEEYGETPLRFRPTAVYTGAAEPIRSRKLSQ